MIDPDATTPAALAAQLRELSLALEQLGTARAELLPATATFWGGEARAAYDRAVVDLGSTLDEVIDTVRLAQRSTALALVGLTHG